MPTDNCSTDIAKCTIKDTVIRPKKVMNFKPAKKAVFSTKKRYNLNLVKNAPSTTRIKGEGKLDEPKMGFIKKLALKLKGRSFGAKKIGTL